MPCPTAGWCGSIPRSTEATAVVSVADGVTGGVDTHVDLHVAALDQLAAQTVTAPARWCCFWGR